MRYPTCFVLMSEEVFVSLQQDQQNIEVRRTLKTNNSFNLSTENPRLPLAKLPGARKRSYLAARCLQRSLRGDASLPPDLDFYNVNFKKPSQMSSSSGDLKQDTRRNA